jgi:ribosomal protein uL24
MRGFFKKKKAKVVTVDLKNSLVSLEGLQKTKKDGSKVNVYFHPSNLQIVTLELADKDRISSLNRKGSVAKAKTESQKQKESKSDKKEKKNASN